VTATQQQIKEQAQAIANQAQAIADGKIPESGQHGHASLILQNARTLYAWASKRDSTKHQYAKGDVTDPAHGAMCRVCHGPKTAEVHE
jgi:hypothetical protein